jgi:hypothetical protein
VEVKGKSHGTSDSKCKHKAGLAVKVRKQKQFALDPVMMRQGRYEDSVKICILCGEFDLMAFS